MPLVLSLDAGTGGAKCAVFDERGSLRGFATQAWEYHVVANPDVPMVKEYSFDPDRFWEVIAACARRAVEAVDAAEVIAVVTTSQREGCVFIGDDDREIYAGPNLDSRGFLEGFEVLEKLGNSRLYEITGHSAPFIFPISRYLWFRKNDQRPIRKLLMMNDWMVWRCCGAARSEPSNASESMLFDFRQREWSQEIVDLFAIDRATLPAIATPGEWVGTLSPQSALELGLPAGTAVHAGGADTQCGLLGVGAIEPGDVAVTLGTTSPVQAVFDRPRLDSSETLWAGCHVVGERWVLESNAGSSGDAYEWLLDLLVGGEAERYQRAEELMASEAAGGQVASFIGPRVFDLSKIRPDLPGAFLFPFPSLQLRPNAGQLLRSFLESLACAVRGNLEQLSAATGAAPQRLRVGGGLSRSRLLVQMVADVTNLPVDLGTVSDATSLGAAILAFTGAGTFPNLHAAVAAMSDCETIEPNPSAPAIAPETYDRWRRLCESVDQLTV